MVKKVGLTEEERRKYTNDYQRITGWATSLCIEKFSAKHGRIPYRFQELQEQAVMGFCQALDTFDASRGISFIKYSLLLMRNEMYDYIIKNNKERYQEVKRYYESIGAFDKLKEYDERQEELIDEDDEKHEKIAKGYDISEDDIRMIKYNSISIVECADLEGLLEYLEEVLDGTAKFVFHNYVNPYGDCLPLMKQKEIAQELKISQAAVAKGLKKVKDLAMEYVLKNQELAY